MYYDLDLSDNKTITNDCIKCLIILTYLNLESNKTITDENVKCLTNVKVIRYKN